MDLQQLLILLQFPDILVDVVGGIALSRFRHGTKHRSVGPFTSEKSVSDNRDSIHLLCVPALASTIRLDGDRGTSGHLGLSLIVPHLHLAQK
jgi:hypothetical protein